MGKAVHGRLVKSEVRLQRAGPQTMGFQDIVDMAIGSFYLIVKCFQLARGLISAHCFYPGHNFTLPGKF